MKWSKGFHGMKNVNKKLRSIAPFQKKEEVSLETNENEYYENISRRFGIAQVVLYCSLFVFVLLSFFRNIDQITYQNFFHFFQDLGATASASDVFFEESVTYPTSSEQDFSLYREGLAVAGNSSLSLFSAGGRQSISVNLDNYRNPATEGTGKYLLVYELGGTRYSLYNFYTQLHEGKSEYPITGATVSDNGMFAIISASGQYASVVTLYNDRFQPISHYRYLESEGYVMDVDVNENGSAIAILTSTSAGDGYRTTLRVYQPGKADAQAQTLISTSLGLDCTFSDKSSVTVLCGNGISFVSASGKINTSYQFGKAKQVAYVSDEDGIMVALEEKDTTQSDSVIAFDKGGKQVYQTTVRNRIEQLARKGDSIFILSAGEIRCLSVKGRKETVWEGTTEGRRMLAVREKEILLCSPQKAVYIPLSS